MTKKSLVTSRILVTLGTLAIAGFLLLAFVAPVIFDRHDSIGHRQSVAVSLIRAIYLSNVAYENEHPQQGYAIKLSDLAERPANAKPGENPAWKIDPVLASGEKGGYKFAYKSQSTKDDGKIDAFQITADPLVPGKTGNHHFYVDQTGVFRVSKDGPAGSSSAVLQ